MLYCKINLETTQQFKISRSLALRRSSLRLPLQTGGTRWKNRFANRAVRYWKSPTLATYTFRKKVPDSYIYLQLLHYIFGPIWTLWATCPFPISKHAHALQFLDRCYDWQGLQILSIPIWKWASASHCVATNVVIYDSVMDSIVNPDRVAKLSGFIAMT